MDLLPPVLNQVLKTPKFRAPVEAREWQEMRDICCESAIAGAPLPRERWDFFGRMWIDPYRVTPGSFAWVAHQPDGSVAGYVTGAKDTPSWERARLFHFDLGFASSSIFKLGDKTRDMKSYLARLFRLELDPNRAFGSDFLKDLYRKYPSHLHINFKASARGQGLGTELIEYACGALALQKVSGIHLFCGKEPVKFYERNGFEIEDEILYKKKTHVFCMTRAL